MFSERVFKLALAAALAIPFSARAADLSAMTLPPALADAAVVVPPVPGRKKDAATQPAKEAAPAAPSEEKKGDAKGKKDIEVLDAAVTRQPAAPAKEAKPAKPQAEAPAAPVTPKPGQIVLGTDDQPIIIDADDAKGGVVDANATPLNALPTQPPVAPAATEAPATQQQAAGTQPARFVGTPAPVAVAREWSRARDIAREYENIIIDDHKVALSEKELQALEMTRSWRDQEEMGVMPLRGEDGAVEFTYGLERPSVVCAVLNITDIELQPGETVSSVNIGDSRRWMVKSAVSGGNTQHLVIKPLAVGLATSMVIATDRRTYHIHLRSTRDDYMARVRFVYADDAAVKLNLMKQAVKKKRDDDTLPGTHEYLGNLDFNYDVKGKAGWKPVRVYNDGVKTILEMPLVMNQTEAPSLLIVQAGEQTLVNYRVQNNRFIIDSVFDKAILMTGVGRKQTRVTITYKGRRK